MSPRCGQEEVAVSFPPSSIQAPRPTSLLTQPRGWVPPSAFRLQPSGSSDAALCQPVCGNRKRPEGHPLRSAPHQNPPASDPPPEPPGRFFGVLSRANCGPLGRSCPWGLPGLYVVMEALSVSRSFLPIGCWGSAALYLNCWSITRFYSQCALY